MLLCVKLIAISLLLFFDRLMVHIREPEMEISSLVHVLSPFVPSLWFLVVSAMMVLTLFLSATWYLRPKSGVTANSAPYRFCDSLLYVLGSFCQQGGQYAPLYSFMSLPLYALSTTPCPRAHSAFTGIIFESSGNYRVLFAYPHMFRDQMR
jgi:hypothetical protein